MVVNTPSHECDGFSAKPRSNLPASRPKASSWPHCPEHTLSGHALQRGARIHLSPERDSPLRAISMEYVAIPPRRIDRKMRNFMVPAVLAVLPFLGFLVGKSGECSRKTRSGSGIRLFPVIVAMCTAMILPLGVVHGTEDPVELQPALVVHLDEWEPPPVSEAEALALRILRRDSGAYPSDSAFGGEVTQEIAGALSTIRGHYPVAANVEAREAYEGRKGLILELEREVFASLARVVGNGVGPFALRTGHTRFDALNAQLGVRAVRVFPGFNSVVFHFDPTVDLDLVAIQYSGLNEVHSVEPDALLSDGPDIEVSRSKGAWYFVFRDAWEDCPSGCINVDLYFFVVQNSDAKRVDPASADSIPEFAEIRENRGWFRRGRSRDSD